jgi:hypothetical protein
VEKLLALLPAELLWELAIETKVDRYAKKLQGEVLFRLLLYCLITTKESSLRSIASAYESSLFGALNTTYGKGTVRYNSISERLSTINADYFKKLFEHCVSAYKDTIGTTDTERLLRFDSTVVSLSGKLLDIGYSLKGSTSDHLRLLKFTIGLGNIPEAASFYSEAQYNSENIALKKTILQTHRQTDNNKEEEEGPAEIKVFDRGITSRATYDVLTGQGIAFVSRINAGAAHTALSQNRLGEPIIVDGLCISEDIDVALFGNQGKLKTKSYLRCIKAKVVKEGKAHGKELWFVTNIGAQHLSAVQVAQVYKRRWDIEVFFKFLKSHLNFSHLLSRSENGVGVMMYVTLIAAILVMAYKKLTGQRGFKLAKQRLAQELETEILKTIIILCGGNPELLHKILPQNSS